MLLENNEATKILARKGFKEKDVLYLACSAEQATLYASTEHPFLQKAASCLDQNLYHSFAKNKKNIPRI